MFPGPNASANVVLNVITDVEAHHVLFLCGRRFAAPTALLCVQIRGAFVSKGAAVQFEFWPLNMRPVVPLQTQVKP
jgi:hypothetical protein